VSGYAYIVLVVGHDSGICDMRCCWWAVEGSDAAAVRLVVWSTHLARLRGCAGECGRVMSSIGVCLRQRGCFVWWI
jgi:hypothetical protein